MLMHNEIWLDLTNLFILSNSRALDFFYNLRSTHSSTRLGRGGEL